MLIGLIYLFTFVFHVLMIGEEEEYPCEFIGSEDEKNFYLCKPIAYYSDLQLGGVRILIITLAAIASGGLIANDMADKSIHLYLSRPISRIDYLIARFIPIFLLLMIATVIPNLIVYITQWSNAGLKISWIEDHSWLILDIILQGIFYSTVYSMIGLTFSTAINREYRAAGAFFLFVYGTTIIVEIFHAIIRDDRILLFSIIHLLDIINFHILDKEFYFTSFGTLEGLDISNMYAFVVLFFLLGGCGIFVNWMISNMEANK